MTDCAEPFLADRIGRKRAELRAKLAGLEDEFGYWRAASGTDGPLFRNHSQIHALTGALTVALDALRADVEAADLVHTWVRVESAILRCHEAWDFFRQKLAPRRVDLFTPYLRLADDFTWACYRPAQQAATGARRREPPLTFLNTISTPYAVPRGSSYARQVGDAVLADDVLRAVVDRLPVPILGVPWFQLRHLPDALILGHEVGHVVESDFGLTATVERLAMDALDGMGAPASRWETWRGWLGEVFADVYAVLAGGPAYGRALADFAATGAGAFSGNDQYPPLPLRVHLVAEALHRPARPGAREDLLAHWHTEFAAAVPADAVVEAAAVARALLAGPYPELGGAALTDVLDYPVGERAARLTATALLRGIELNPGIDVRGLLTAAALAFGRDPQAYEDVDATNRVLAHAKVIEKQGLRNLRPAPRPPGRDTTDTDTGADVLRLLTGGG